MKSLISEQISLTKSDLEDVVEIIEFTRKTFQEKLSLLKTKMKKETDPDKKAQLLARSKEIYHAYQNSLTAIEAYIDIKYQQAGIKRKFE
ncbi:MAG: hypothetical protein Q7S03_04330 [bacterium]|nr:hypothetical protein [bacterium]